MEILIVGAGIGGLALAAFCEKSGIKYDIIEKQNDETHHGFTLGMWANGRRMFIELGLGDLFDKNAVPIKFFNIYTGKGRSIRRYKLSKFYEEYGMGYFHLRRQDIITWLGDLLPKDKVWFGTTVTNIEKAEQKNIVTFSNGKQKTYDLVVAADGISSDIREKYVEQKSRKFTDWRVWYLWVDAKNAEKLSVTTYCEANHYAAFFSEGSGPALAIMAAREDHTLWDSEEKRLETLRKLFDKELFITKILEGRLATDILPTDLSEIHTSHMYKDRIVLLGDAAHGFEPFAGLGGSMALEDAYVLAAELINHSDIDSALQLYEMKRKKRVAKALAITQRMQLIVGIRPQIFRMVLNTFIRFVSDKFFIKQYFRFLNEEL